MARKSKKEHAINCNEPAVEHVKNSKHTKETLHAAANDVAAFKNTIYKYKDGSTCRVVYNGQDQNYITIISN
jgi:hypothetical protein